MRYILPVLSAFSLIACDNGSEQNTNPVKDVQYYLDNAEERKAKTLECEKNLSELQDTPNCRNADEAERKAFIRELKDAANSNR